MEAKNKKLFSNIFLMFLMSFMPKIFSFFLVPIYTSYLTTEEYGISDLIISTASLIIPFISLATPSAILRFTIEDKDDKRPYQTSLKVYIRGMILLLVIMTAAYFIFKYKISYLLFIYLIVGAAILSDINVSYTRGLEKMKLITFCGVGSALVSILCNIIFIVVLNQGMYGFLLASLSGYAFNIIVLNIANIKKNLLKGIFIKNKTLEKEMLQFSIPLILSGISWWIVSSSDRYFVSWMCSTASNGIYSVAYKIPSILQALDNVFGQAWIFTLYDSYKTSDGKAYIAKVFSVYNFIFILGCSFLIVINIIISRILYSNEFFTAWRYVPFLLLSIVFNSASGLMGGFFIVYKKTKITMNISLISAVTNIILNAILIYIFNDAIGAAIATALTFFISWLCTAIVGIKISGVRIDLNKQLLMYFILFIQAMIIIKFKNMYLASFGLLMIILLNLDIIIWAKDKWKMLLNINR